MACNGGMNEMLKVRNIVTKFGTASRGVKAVDGASFDVEAGKIVGIVGESGSGKSTLVRSCLGLISPPGYNAGGECLFEGRDLMRLPHRELRKVRGCQIGFVAQNPFGSLNPVLPIWRQFANVLRAHTGRISNESAKAKAAEQLRMVGIHEPERVLSGYARELSGGMAQRVVIAIATILEPRLLIADEPTTALDMTVQRQILDLLRSLVRSKQRSMLLVTHDLGVVAQYCDEVIVMYAGGIVETGAVGDVLVNPAHPYTRALVNSVPRRGQKFEILHGRVPIFHESPAGCRFVSRCREALDICHVQAPPRVEVKTGWYSNCQLTGLGVKDARLSEEGGRHACR